MNEYAELSLLRAAAEKELRAIEALAGPMDALHAEAIRTAFKGGAKFGAERARMRPDNKCPYCTREAGTMHHPDCHLMRRGKSVLRSGGGKC